MARRISARAFSDEFIPQSWTEVKRGRSHAALLATPEAKSRYKNLFGKTFKIAPADGKGPSDPARMVEQKQKITPAFGLSPSTKRDDYLLTRISGLPLASGKVSMLNFSSNREQTKGSSTGFQYGSVPQEAELRLKSSRTSRLRKNSPCRE